SCRPSTAIVICTLLAVAMARVAYAQGSSAPDKPSMETTTTMASHSPDASWWLSGQLNVIGQFHGGFHAPYSGPNSLQPAPEHAVSRVWTIDGGVRTSKRTDLWVDVESAGGRGISDALGLAGFTNLDVVRNPTLGATPYVARVMIHVTVPFGSETTPTGR